MVPVKGGFLEQDQFRVELVFICRQRVGKGIVYGSVDLSRAYRGVNLDAVGDYEVLVRSQAPQDQDSPPLEACDKAQVMVGKFYPDNHSAHVKKGDRYSTAVYFNAPLKANIMKETFILNAETWGETYLYHCGVNWAAISEPTWRCGVLNVDGGRSLWKVRGTFSPAFQSPPMVFACFSGLDMTGSFNWRIHVTSVDHTGFDLSILKTREGKVGLASISWVAIPGEEVLKRKNAWIGRFSTDSLSADKNGEYTGSVKFGFEFRRDPKIFVGVDHIDFTTDRHVRLVVSTSNVSKTGMDWRIKKWDETVLKGAGASYLALDCD
ncbi:hypothetical protein FA13DRAFT_1742589 [Coprinellus micaceus]|uniref:H-type lectin domain-containing protein n=1 Tax=Coprinellus micaceus TaxID=71717 RepID=A0A4Y7SGA8_COPMI|nr:hypothetical protein FA13DRAFT_1742589 [Coprinellus micaceus]